MDSGKYSSNMVSDKGGTAGDGGGWAGQACDSCRLAPCAVYCRADAAYLCAGCDARVHEANRLASRHERVWVCEACERAPAALTCRADAAALCEACDADVHSAHPLARRHHRVPILPLPPGRITVSTLGHGVPTATVEGGEPEPTIGEEEENEAASWLLLNPLKNNNQSNMGFLYGGEVDKYIDADECNENQNQESHHQYGEHQQQLLQKNEGGECVVPVQCVQTNEQHQQQRYQMEMEYEASKAGFSYAASLSHSVSLSPMDASIVPDTTMTDILNCNPRTSKGTIDLFSGPPLEIPPQFTPMDREARVLRYREKRKTRKFEKTIRYASRKAYAETRPRIKGRFAKRSDVELEVDHMFSASLLSGDNYVIVPSF